MDQHIFAGNPQALKMVIWMVEYFYNRVQNVISKHSIEQHWLSLNEETGGMNDVLYRLYIITVSQTVAYIYVDSSVFGNFLKMLFSFNFSSLTLQMKICLNYPFITDEKLLEVSLTH